MANSRLPKVYVDRVTLETGGDQDGGQLNSTVDICIRHEVGNSQIFEWISNPTLSQNLKIKLVQSTNELETAELQAFIDAGQSAEALNYISNSAIESSDISILESGIDVNNFDSYIINHTERESRYMPAERPYSPEGMRVLDPGDYEGASPRHRPTEDSSGEAGHYFKDRKFISVAKLYFKRKYTHAEARPKHLTYFAFTYSGTTISQISTVPAIENRRANHKSVQDFRSIDRVRRLNWSESKSESGLSITEKKIFSANNKLRHLKNDNMMPSQKESYFSNIMLSRDVINQCAFGFFVDYHNLVKNHSLYKNLYSSLGEVTSSDILSNSKILSLSIIKRRIKPDTTTLNKLGTPVGHEVFVKNHIVDAVVTTRDVSAGNLKEISFENNSGSIKELNISALNKGGLRYITGVDKSTTKSNGVCQYGVEIVFDDNITRYLNGRLLEMRTLKKKVDKYLSDASNVGMSKFLLIEEPHLDHSWERSKEIFESTGNYNSTSNRFTQKFIDEQNTLSDDDKVWKKPIEKYFKTSNMLTSRPFGEETKASLVKMLDPSTASPRSVLAVSQLVGNTIARLTHLIGFSEYSFSPSPHARSTSKLPVKTTTITHWFENDEFNSDFLNAHGYDYLSRSKEGQHIFNTNSLRTLSAKAYTQRVSDERSNYFNGGSPSPYDWSFLSPAYCFLGPDQQFSFYGSSEEEKSMYSFLESNVLLYNNASTGKQLTSSNAQTINGSLKNTLRDFYSNVNVTVRPLNPGCDPSENNFSCNDDIDLIPASSTTVCLSLMKTFSKTGLANSVSNTSPYGQYGNKYLLGTTEYNTQDIEIGFYRAGGAMFTHLEQSDLSNSIMLSCGYDTAEVDISKLPMQIRSISAGTEISVDDWNSDPTRDRVLSSYFHFKYSMINRVDVLVGFATSNEDSKVKSPIWQPLTESLWAGEQVGQFLICRMKPFDCPQIGIEQPKGLKLPVYDNYFILEPAKPNSSSDTSGTSGTGFQVYANKVR